MSGQNRNELKRAEAQSKIEAIETAQKVLQREKEKQKQEMGKLDDDIRQGRIRGFGLENAVWLHRDPSEFQCIEIKWNGKIWLAVVRADFKVSDRRGGVLDYFLCDLYRKDFNSKSKFLIDFQNFPVSLKDLFNILEKPRAIHMVEGVIVTLKL